MTPRGRRLDALNLVPFPARIVPRTGRFRPKRALKAYWSCGDRQNTAFILGELAQRGIPSAFAAGDKGGLSLVLTSGAAPGQAPAPPSSESPEAYRLIIAPSRVAASARTAAGLLRAWQTFTQIESECSGGLPCGVIDDAPALEMRLVHLDLKGAKPKAAYLLQALERLAAYKINGVLVEVEDHIRYERHPDIAHPQALSRSFYKRFAERARELHVEVIPLLQTWGHLQYLLRVPRYRHLAESHEGSRGEICPSHPEAWPLLTDMIDELCEVFPHSRYLHVGLDEVHAIGKCRLCEPRLRKLGRNRMFAEEFNRRAEYVAAKGRVPMVWDDMFTRSFRTKDYAHVARTVEVAGRDGSAQATPFMSAWEYGAFGPTSMSCNFAGGLSTERALKKEAGLLPAEPDRLATPITYGTLPPAAKALARRYILTDDPDALNPFYAVDILTDKGYPVLGLPAIQYSAGVMGRCPDFSQRQVNVLAHARYLKEKRARGIIGSWWARGHSNAQCNAPFECAWYGICSLADFAWRPLGREDVDDFDRRWCAQFLGIHDTYPVDALYQLSMSARRMHHGGRDLTGPAREGIARALREATRNRYFLEMVDVGMHVHQLHLRRQGSELGAEYLYPTMSWMPEQFRRGMLRELDEVAGQYRALAREMRLAYGRSIVRRDVQEFIAADVEVGLLRTKQIRDLIRRAMQRKDD